MSNAWQETDSAIFSQYASNFTPYRELQTKICCSLLSQVQQLEVVWDVCCGDGYWGEKFLSHLPKASVKCLDGSPLMLEKCKDRLQSFDGRFGLQQIDMADRTWRRSTDPVQAIFSSLALHHLPGLSKKTFFQDMFELLDPGGLCLIVDLVKASRPVGTKVSADLWNRWVAEQSGEGSEAFRYFKDDHWNYYDYPDEDPIDQPSSLLDQVRWMEDSGFKGVDVSWMYAGHTVFYGWKP